MILYTKYLEIMKISAKKFTAYVSHAWASILVNILQIIVYYYIWMAVYGGKTEINGISKSQIVTYIILSKFLMGRLTFGANSQISRLIENGDIGIQLLKPVDIQLYFYFVRIGDFISSIVFEGIPVIVVSVMLFGFQLPKNISNIFCFFISLILAISISYIIEFSIGIMTFYTTNGLGLQGLKVAFISFFSGALIPLDFLPNTLKQIIEVLPFKDIVYTPISIYLNVLTPIEMIKAIIVQGFWLITLFIISKVFYSIAIKKVIVQGG